MQPRRLPFAANVAGRSTWLAGSTSDTPYLSRGPSTMRKITTRRHSEVFSCRVRRYAHQTASAATAAGTILFFLLAGFLHKRRLCHRATHLAGAASRRGACRSRTRTLAVRPKTASSARAWQNSSAQGAEPWAYPKIRRDWATQSWRILTARSQNEFLGGLLDPGSVLYAVIRGFYNPA